MVFEILDGAFACVGTMIVRFDELEFIFSFVRYVWVAFDAKLFMTLYSGLNPHADRYLTFL